MAPWLTSLLAQTGPAILVTVARAEGSAPREAGAKMLVNAERQFDTIGGGHLEFNACGFARAMLALPANDFSGRRRLQRFALGPTLGQCCGGVVWLAFERIDVSDHDCYACLQERYMQGQGSLRISRFDAEAPLALLGAGNDCIVAQDHDIPPECLQPEMQLEKQACHIAHTAAGACWLVDPVMPHKHELFLFGAGHVGAAIVKALTDLPCRVTWIDEREDIFPDSVPVNATVEATDTPEALIDAAPAGASFLVMTHSHALDQRLAERILRRDDFGWFGLIGSRTKRVQFERRMRERGIAPDRLARMICPIGVPGIAGKAPAVIAVAVAAQLLQAWERQEGQLSAMDETRTAAEAGRRA